MKRRWFQYTLRTALLLATVFCVWLGWWANRAHQQRLAVQRIQSLSGGVDYERRPNDTRVPKWLRSLLGDDFFVNVNQVSLAPHRENRQPDKPLTPDELDQIVAAMQRLPRLKRLSIDHTGLRDEDLSRLAPLRKRIEYIGIASYTKEINGQCIAHFRDWPRLKSLDLLSSHLDPHTLDQLAALPSLEYFHWSHGALDAVAFAHIARCRKLRVLHLWACSFDGEALTSLRAAPCLKELGLTNIYAVRIKPYAGKVDDPSGPLQFISDDHIGFGDPRWDSVMPWGFDLDTWIQQYLPGVKTSQGFMHG
jgi:hypothetical protein